MHQRIIVLEYLSTKDRSIRKGVQYRSIAIHHALITSSIPDGLFFEMVSGSSDPLEHGNVTIRKGQLCNSHSIK